jgi:hypothetical protein
MPKNAVDMGVEAFKVRVVVGGATLHLLSAIEPVVNVSNAAVVDVRWMLIDGTEHGDTVGFIRWSEVTAITWRWAGARKSPSKSNGADEHVRFKGTL